MRDAGIYECQVNTEPKMSMAFRLNVVGELYFVIYVECWLWVYIFYANLKRFFCSPFFHLFRNMEFQMRFFKIYIVVNVNVKKRRKKEETIMILSFKYHQAFLKQWHSIIFCFLFYVPILTTEVKKSNIKASSVSSKSSSKH